MEDYLHPDKRAGNADRDRYVDHLAAMVASGHLKQEEFESRRDSALEAVTHGNLQELVSDLPSLPEPPARRMRTYRVAVNGRRCHMKTWLAVTGFFIVTTAFTGPVCAGIWHGFGHAPLQGGLTILLILANIVAGLVWGVTMAPDYERKEYIDD